MLREMEEEAEQSFSFLPAAHHEATGKGCRSCREPRGECCWVPLLLASPGPRRVCVLAAGCVTLPVSLSMLSSNLGKGFCSICPALFHHLCFSCKARVLDLC